MKTNAKLLTGAVALSLVMNSVYMINKPANVCYHEDRIATTKQQQNEKSDLFKDETVYVIADATGKPTKVIVSDELQNVGNQTITDQTILDQFENVSGDETYTNEKGKVIWQGKGENITYQGTTTKQLPVSMDITYTLDGKKISPDELAGKSGHLVMHYAYTNHETYSTTINGKKENVNVPFMVMTGTVLDGEVFSHVSVKNGKLIVGDQNIVLGYAMPGLQNSLGIQKDDIEIPEYFEIEADVTNFSLLTNVTYITNSIFNDLDLNKIDSLDDLTGQMEQLNMGALQLKDGSKTLYEGLTTLQEKSGTLTSGVDQLVTGSSTLKDGTSTLHAGIVQLDDGATSLVDGSQQLDSGAHQLVDGSKQVSDGTTVLADGTKQVNDGARQLAAGTNELVNSVPALMDGVGQLNTGASSLAAGASQVHSGAGALKDGIDATNQGANQLVNGSNDLVNGLTQINGGMDHLVTGLGTLNDNTPVLKAGATQVFQTLLESTSAQLQGAGLDVTLTIENYDATLTQYIQYFQGNNMDATTLINAKASLDAYNGFYQGLNHYFDGVVNAYQGSMQLQDALTQASAGAGSIRDGATQLYNATQQLLQGATELAAGTNELSAGASTLSEGTSSLATGANTLITGASALNTGANDLVKGTSELYDGSLTLLAGTTQLYQGSVSLADGLDALVGGADTLKAGTSELNSGSNELDQGAGFLKAGLTTLQEGTVALIDGVNQLQAGSKTLADGMATLYDEGISKIVSLISSGDIEGIMDHIEALKEASTHYSTFTTLPEDVHGSVKFIIRTESID